MAQASCWIIFAVVLCGCLFSQCWTSPLAKNLRLRPAYQKRSVLGASPMEPWGDIFSSNEECLKALNSMHFRQDKEVPFSSHGCHALWDGVLCWPATPAGTKVYQSCPNMPGLDTENFAERSCQDSGHWAGRDGINAIGNKGWTDYRPCYTPYARALYQKYYGDLK